MGFCNKCGRELADGDEYCPKCGAPNALLPSGGKPYLNVLAIVGMALSASGASPLAGLIVSVLAYKKAVAAEFRYPLKGLAKAGIISGAVATGIVALILLLYAAHLLLFPLIWGSIYVLSQYS